MFTAPTALTRRNILAASSIFGLVFLGRSVPHSGARDPVPSPPRGPDRARDRRLRPRGPAG